jgi:hypothetical protein
MAEELAADDAIHISTVVAPDIAIMYCPLVAWRATTFSNIHVYVAICLRRK